MSTCNGCGGVVGRDCFNPQECEWISHQQEARHMAEQYAPDTQELEQRMDALEHKVSGIEVGINRLITELLSNKTGA